MIVHSACMGKNPAFKVFANYMHGTKTLTGAMLPGAKIELLDNAR